MRRILTVMTVMAMMVVATAMPAMATNYENANCLGYVTSYLNQTFPGAGGVAYIAPHAQAGQGINELALYGTCVP